MARGPRAPSQNAYRGALGRTQTQLVHVTGPKGELISAKVHTTVDAVENPELVDRLLLDQLGIVAIEGSEAIKIAVPVVYHDSAAELLVLVLDPSQRHRELDERIRLLEQLRTDDAAIPAYVKEAAVVFGGRELRDYLERRAAAAVEIERGRIETEKRVRELERRGGEVERRAGELDRKSSELDAANTEVANRIVEIEKMRAELARDRAEIERLRSEARNRVIAAVQAASSSTAEANAEETTAVGDVPRVAPPAVREPTAETSPVPKMDLDLDESGGIAAALSNLVEHHEPMPRAASEGFEGATGVSDASEIRANAASGELGSADVDVEVDEPAARDASHDFDEEHTTGASIIPQGSDPLTSETVPLEVEGGPDAWLDRAAASGSSAFAVTGGHVRLALAAGDQIARGLGGIIDVRVLLHRAPTYPVISLVLGPPAALRVPSPTQLAILTLDIAADGDRQVLAALAKRFEIALDLIVRGKRVRRAKLIAPLSENVGFIVRAAEDHLRGLMSSNGADSEASYGRAVELVRGAGHDLLGTNHPDTSEFRDDKLAQLQTAQQLRRAIAMARRFARPSREDYLVCTRGFPLPRWRELRRHVLESAVAWGLWMGAELAQVAVSEGLARSRRDLIVKLDRGFETLKANPAAFDIDEEAADDNQKALAEEARALGVDLDRRSRPSQQMPKLNGLANGKTIASDEVSQVSGSIGGTPAHGVTRPKPSAELVGQLDDKTTRLAAALELCDRAEAAYAAPVVEAATRMSRAEAVRVLGMSVKFGEAAKLPLMAGLASSKGFLRHGCALALAMLRTEDGTQAVIDLLMSEPTEIWREVARAIGQVGPVALLPLASTYGRLGESATPSLAERVAWAMAHVAVRGGKAAVETMAGGQSIVAPVAKQALTFHASAANDQVRVRPGANGSQVGRDVTVNRAFSRRFFEALEAGVPEAGHAGLVDLEASQPMEMLDESDLIEDDDEVDLDESDLIQT